jgi:hypothetical protein
MAIGVDIGLIIGGSLSGAINYPLINGFRPSWASAEFKFNLTGSGAAPNYSMQSADYKLTRTRKKTRGTNVNPLGKTRGSIDYTCKIKMLLAEWNALAGQLAGLDPTGNNGYGDVFFTLHISWADPASVIIEDVILGCTLDTAEQSSSEGDDDIVVESELNPLLILRNGLPMSQQPLGAPQI